MTTRRARPKFRNTCSQRLRQMKPQTRVFSADLLPQHRDLLTGSAISPPVAEDRGYFSARTKVDLRDLGFGVSQALSPALVIPIYGVSGERVLYQIRPDKPRINGGKPVKYETPAKSGMVIDVPPSIRSKLGKPSCPLYITEGARKADAAVSKGLCCVALLGVWNWRGTNAFGGKTALPDWELIALNGREVFVAFDSDVMTKKPVHLALFRLKQFLEHRGAQVKIINLPPGKKGQKVGLDDYFAAGKSVDDLLKLATETLEQPPDLGPYTVENGRICIERVRDGVHALEPLCNFDARVEEELVLDNGAEVSRALVIDGRLDSGAALPAIRVPVNRFQQMNWVTEEWGVVAVTYAGQATRDRLRDAIQRLSVDVRRRTVLTHTGWRKIGEKWCFVHAGGTVNGDSVEVDLGAELRDYQLVSPPTDVRGAIKASLELLEIADDSITIPLLAACFRAPLSQIVSCDFSLWLEGLTGSLKSTLAALFLSHFGSFHYSSLPGNWSSTANQLEKRAFTLKDVLFVIDDYAPQGQDRRELEAKAARVLRAQGNHSGRARLRQDLTERPSFPPRGLVISTGEDRPSARSIVARTMVIEVDRKAVRLPALTAAQKHADRLTHAMSGYIAWLAPRMDDLQKSLAGRLAKLRKQAEGGTSHLRIPGIGANLMLGFDLLLEFAVECKAYTTKQVERHRTRAVGALNRLAASQSDALRESRPTQIFFSTLSELLVQGRITVNRVSNNDVCLLAVGSSQLVGWYDDDWIYLIPGLAYRAVNEAMRASGSTFPLSDGRLRRDLRDEGLSRVNSGSTTTTKWIAGRSNRVLQISRPRVADLLGTPLTLEPPSLTGLTGSGDKRDG